MIGRALVALYRRQTSEERANEQTRVRNNVGFTGPDARSGTLAARSYLKHGRFLEEWQWKRWTIPNKKGYPRIAKYARQLNEVAQIKQQQEA